eukprot:12643131-Heterocapsa_arctica.AAC.1
MRKEEGSTLISGVRVVRSGTLPDDVIVCRSTTRLRRPPVDDDVPPEVQLLRGPARESSA